MIKDLISFTLSALWVVSMVYAIFTYASFVAFNKIVLEMEWFESLVPQKVPSIYETILHYSNPQWINAHLTSFSIF